MTTFSEELTIGLSSALEPLQSAFSNEAQLRQFFADFGWDVNVSPASMGAIRAGFALESVFDDARVIVEQLESDSGDAAALSVALKDAIVNIIDAVKQLRLAPPGGLPFPLDQPAFWDEVPPAMGDFLLLRFLEAQLPPLYGTLRLLGLAEITKETPVGLGRLPYSKLAIRWDRLPKLIGNPAGLLREIYKWDTAAQPFAYAELFEALKDSFQALRFPARDQGVSATLATRYYDPTNPTLSQVQELAIPFFSTASPDWSSYAEVGLVVLPIPPKGNPDQPPVGIVLAPLASGTVGGGTPNSMFALTLKGGFHAEDAFGAEIRPTGVEVFAAPDKTTIDAEVVFSSHSETPWRLVGDPDSFRVEVAGFEAGLAVRGQIESPEVIASVGTGSGPNPPKVAIVIQTSDADGFLGTLIGTQPIRLEAGGRIVWSSQSGLYLEGSGGFEYAIPMHLNLGIAEISILTVALRGSGAGIVFDAGVTSKAMLGPLTAVVENFGLRTTLNFSGPDGKLGPVDIGLGFRPPNGVGLALDAAAIKGGGYLYIDAERGEYAGALELTFSNAFALKAIGLITTKMPDGSKGFSLLIIITAEFATGIQLGFGFTLLAVGGLVGLNRTMKLQPLMEGIRTGAVNSIMFPRDVVANAPRIISDLRTIFPPQEGTFLIGPMAKLAWGTPALIRLSLGIIIEIPGNIAILGVLRVALPADEAEVLVLQVNFAGAIEFDKRRIYFFAALFESRMLFMTIDGEMALLVAFGDDPNFVASVGGFHPGFNPPPLPVPSPHRVSVNLVNSPSARVRIEGYFAVTSNTAQFGARAELFFGLDEVNVEGHLGFDALFQFSPFNFIIAISASFSVKVFGAGLFSVRIRGSLEGPTPWRVSGEGSISLLFFDISVDFSVTWGESRDTMLPPIAVMPLFKAEFEKGENWRALLPASNNLLVALRKMPAEEAALVLHPVGVLRVTQRALPLELELDKVGNQKPNDVDRLSVAVRDGALSKKGDTFEQFAPAQFENLNDGDRLSRSAFEPERAGLDLSVAGEDLRSSGMVKRVVRYEEIILDTNFKRFVRRFFPFSSTMFDFFLNGASVTKSDLSLAKKQQFQPFEEKIDVQAETYTVAYQANNKAYAADSVSFVSEASARDFLTREVAKDTSLAETLHVIPSYEGVA